MLDRNDWNEVRIQISFLNNPIFRPNVYGWASCAIVGGVSTSHASDDNTNSNATSAYAPNHGKCNQTLSNVCTSLVATQLSSPSTPTHNRAKYSVFDEGSLQ